MVNYVGRYTHRVAISNHRIVDIEGGEVKFTWRDYRNNNQQKTMTLSADQFIGRFLLHVLPSGFHRIRYSRFLANPHRHHTVEFLPGSSAAIERLSSDVPVHPVTLAIARLAGRIEGQQEAIGVQFAFEDLLIGATALHLGYEVATLNLRDFKRIPALCVIQL